MIIIQTWHLLLFSDTMSPFGSHILQIPTMWKKSTNRSLFSIEGNFSVNIKDLQASTLVGLTQFNPAPDPLDVQHLDNRSYIMLLFPGHETNAGFVSHWGPGVQPTLADSCLSPFVPQESSSTRVSGSVCWCRGYTSQKEKEPDISWFQWNAGN